MSSDHHQPEPQPPTTISANNEEEQSHQNQRPEETGEPKKEKPYSFPVTTLKLLSSYASSSRKAREGGKETDHQSDARKLSTMDIIRLASRFGSFSVFMHPYSSGLLGVSEEEEKDVELAQLLLSAAENTEYQYFDRAKRLLTRCENLASEKGNPVQRIVYYFAEALRERIDRKTARVKNKKAEEHGGCTSLPLVTSLPFMALHQKIPFIHGIQFAAMQQIVENVASATKVHVIDLRIRCEAHWTILMQTLAERDTLRIELLKITAVTTNDYKKDCEESCKRLHSFANSFNLPFSFKVVSLSDMKGMMAELIDTAPDETIVVYAPLILSSMISRPDCLDGLIRAIRSLKPAIMVVYETEAEINSPLFLKRFMEALLHFSAFFDCLEDCVQRDNKYRLILEGFHLREAILNMVVKDGEEWTNRSMRIDAWRPIFARFGMVEVELSESSLYQASLVVKQCPCGSLCTIDKNGKSLIFWWKGSPLLSLSTWKFS
ncbi:DELLA protein RGL2-like [Diospyros lotus]|uniref:DELLA protein RGL2-like n=1 Tax=Diospyros lotus TaxID=55363 RepID=UPI0022597FDD|nr:DELLA protein RGL2-like [Diospyros lotus]